MKFIIKNIKSIQIDKDIENEHNFWMYTFDFKEKKKGTVFDRDSKEVLLKKHQKNQLIVLLYLVCSLMFIYINLFLTKMLFFILN